MNNLQLRVEPILRVEPSRISRTFRATVFVGRKTTDDRLYYINEEGSVERIVASREAIVCLKKTLPPLSASEVLYVSKLGIAV